MVKRFFLFVSVFFLGYTGYAQCASYVKSKCLPKLKPYMSNEQTYNTTLLAGDKASVPFTFYYGDEYRIVIAAAEALGKIQLNLKDPNNNVVFTTKSYGTIMWDFNVENTQELTLEIITPPSPQGQELDKSGCIAVAIGFK